MGRPKPVDWARDSTTVNRWWGQVPESQKAELPWPAHTDDPVVAVEIRGIAVRDATETGLDPIISKLHATKIGRLGLDRVGTPTSALVCRRQGTPEQCLCK